MGRHLQQLEFVAALWYNERNSGHLHVGQHGHYYFIVFQIEFLLGFHYGIAQNLLNRLFKSSLVLKSDAAHYRASTHVHVVYVDIGVVVVDSEYVNVVKCLTHDDTLGLITLHKLIFFFQHLCLLKAQFFAQTLHFKLQIVEQFLGFATKYLLHVIYHVGILFGAYLSGAASEAVLKMILKA